MAISRTTFAAARRRLSFLILSLLLGAISLYGSPIIYDVHQTVGDGSVNGFVETDGTFGVLSSSNIVDWNLVVYDPNNLPAFDILGPLSGSNSQLAVVGSDLSATASQLLFNFSASDDGYALFQYPLLDTGHYLWCLQSAGDTFACSANPNAGETVATSGGNQVSSLSGNDVVGAIAPEPSPSALLLAAGIAFLGFRILDSSLRRNR